MVQNAFSPPKHTKKIQGLHVETPVKIVGDCIFYILRVATKCMYNVSSWSVRIFTVLKTGICDRSLTEIVGLNPAWAMDVSCECCVLSGSGLYLGLITRPEGTYRVGRVQRVWSRSPIRGGHDSEWGRSAVEGEKVKPFCIETKTVWEDRKFPEIGIGLASSHNHYCRGNQATILFCMFELNTSLQTI